MRPEVLAFYDEVLKDVRYLEVYDEEKEANIKLRKIMKIDLESFK